VEQDVTDVSGSKVATAVGRRSFLIGGSLLALAGCAQVNFTSPKADVADSIDGAAPARAAQGGKWWQSFNDPLLNQLIDVGHARNLDLKQAVEAINAAAAASRATGAADMPQLGGFASATRASTFPNGITESTSTGLSVSWLLDIFGANSNARKAAEARLDASTFTAAATKLMIEGAIASAYADLRFYQASAALTRRSIASRKESRDITRKLVEIGEGARLDLLQADQLVAEGEAQLPAYEIGFDQALAKLASLTAQRSANLRPLVQKGGNQPTPRFKPSVGIPADVVRARPDVAVSERLYAAAAYEVGVAKAQFYPSVALSGNLTATALKSGGSITDWALGPALNLPIFSGGANMANLKASEANALKAKYAWEASVLSAIEEVEIALAAYSRDARNIAAQQRLVDTGRQATVLTRTNYNLGESSFMQVLDAERSYLGAQQGLASAQHQRALNFIGLSLASAGGVQAR